MDETNYCHYSDGLYVVNFIYLFFLTTGHVDGNFFVYSAMGPKDKLEIIMVVRVIFLVRI